jgi:hypothetical protein
VTGKTSAHPAPSSLPPLPFKSIEIAPLLDWIKQQKKNVQSMSSAATVGTVVANMQRMYAAWPAAQTTAFAGFIFSDALLLPVVTDTAQRIRRSFVYQDTSPALASMPWDQVYAVLKHLAQAGPGQLGVHDIGGARRCAMARVYDQVIKPIYNNAQMGSASFAMARRAPAMVKPGTFRDPTVVNRSNDLSEGQRIRNQTRAAAAANNVAY